MDIHKPKPWHGVREFLKEYAIIVVGVLTALAAEQGVEWLHWQDQAERARAALAVDFEGVLTNASERVAVTPCIVRRIQDLSRLVDRASGDRRLPPLGFVGEAPSRPWNLRSWETLQASGTMAHMPRSEMQRYSSIQLYLVNRQAIRDQERHNWTVLNGLVGPGRPFGEAEETEMRAMLSLVSGDAGNMLGGARDLRGRILATHLLTETRKADAERHGVRLARENDICQPIGPPPLVSGGMLVRLETLAAERPLETHPAPSGPTSADNTKP